MINITPSRPLSLSFGQGHAALAAGPDLAGDEGGKQSPGGDHRDAESRMVLLAEHGAGLAGKEEVISDDISS